MERPRYRARELLRREVERKLRAAIERRKQRHRTAMAFLLREALRARGVR